MKRSTTAAAGLAALAAGLLTRRLIRRSRRLDLTGLVAVVTGGGRGLGLAITRELIARGCRVAIASRDGALIEKSALALREAGADVFGMACDASNPVQVDQFVSSVIARYGKIDILVNNAGQCFAGPAVELSSADLDYALQNIFWVHYYPTMAILPYMRDRKFGRIANITSFAGKVPVPHQAAYVAGKYAATGWSQTLSVELAKEGIFVSTITPPPLRNGAPLNVHFNGRVDGEFSWFTFALTSVWTAATAERAARVVVDALRHGDGERAVGGLSWFLSRAQGMAPNLMARALGWVDGFMPPAGPPGVLTAMRLGSDVARTSSDAKVRRLANRARADEARYLPPSGEAASGPLPTRGN